VIVTYRSRPTIDAALTAARTCHDAGVLRCVVVDNHGGDGLVEHVREQYPFATVIDAGGNLGFGRGCNVGAALVETEYVLFINPDAVLELDALSILVHFMDTHPAAGIVGPAIKGQNAGMLTQAGDVLLQAFAGHEHPDRRLTEPGGTPFQTNWICGAAMLMRTKLFRDLSGFDPRFFLYFEETDLCRRAAAAGAEIWVVQAAEATHLAGASTKQAGAPMHFGMIAEHYYQSRFYYLRKHHGLATAVATELLVLAPDAARAVRDRLKGDRVRQEALASRLRRSFLRFPPKPVLGSRETSTVRR
jgi:hypothetical protein